MNLDKLDIKKLIRYSKEELNLIEESLSLGCTYKDISDFILEDFGIIRTIDALKVKCSKLGWKNSSKTKLHRQFIEEVSLTNSTIVVLAEYINNKTKIKCKCIICEYIWYPIASSLIQGYGCPKCALKKHPGAYQQMTKVEADALPYPLYLYKVKLQFEDEIFYKFGLTKNVDRSRYNKYKPYTVIEELSFEELDAWAAKCKEAKLVSNYEPIFHFSGWTECYI